ncbi:MAG: hypothetical protein H7A47_17785 [Verrucomicrobiales bacterium]|nr:hypothetical protein [Verrucomicrobiales bacterium]
MKKGVATVILLLAVGLWAWRFLAGTELSESDLRRTAGVRAEVVASRATPRGVEVTCRVSNPTGRGAAQVVLRVALVDTNGQMLAANPLAGVADLAAGQSREARFLVPLSQPLATVRPDVAVSLVRWRD